MADIKLTKQAAAHRLIISAARMATEDNDELATHVVAACAVNLLRELHTARGTDLTQHALQYSFYSQAVARIEGRPTGFEGSDVVEEIVDYVVAAIKSGNVKNHMDLKIDLPEGEDRRYLDPILKPFNYLKHAQRDPLATLDELDVDPLHALRVAIAAYYFLFPGEDMTPAIIEFCEAQGWTHT
jgi:hypothetical protein